MAAAPAIGIDLGTTNSCVAVMRYGKVEIIANEQGYFITPSYVAFNEFESFVGDAAKDQIAMNPTNTIFDAKRMLGRKFDDPIIQSDMKNWPFTVVDVDNEPRIEVELKGQRKLYAPEQISAMVLHQMKETAEAYLNQEVTDAVITVPAYFNNAQRQATHDAGQIAGLNILRIINEPTAAAVAYNYYNYEQFHEGINVLVYDLGGGTFDVSIMNMSNHKLSVVATNGDTHLGGEDFDCSLVDYCVQQFRSQHKVDLHRNKHVLRRLRSACEVAKRCLSTTTQKEIVVDSSAYGVPISISISRAKFEALNSKQFRKTLEPVQKALNDANLSKDEINRVVLVGGSTRIPKIKTMLQNFFGGIVLDTTLNPDEAVAYGAAVHAAVLKGDVSDQIFGKLLQDITPLSLGSDMYRDNVFSTKIIVPRNTPIPCSMSTTSATRHNNQKKCEFTIRQGESREPERNFLLGKFRIHNLSEGPAGSVKFHTIFNVNANGILIVTGTEIGTGNTKSIKIENVSDHSRNKRLEKMMEDAKKDRIEIKLRKTATRAKVALESECYRIRDKLNDSAVLEAADLDGHDNSIYNIVEKCGETINWLEANPSLPAAAYDCRMVELSSLFEKLSVAVKDIVTTD